MVNWLVARQNWTSWSCDMLWTLPFNSNARSTNCPFQFFFLIWLDTNISILFDFKISKGSLSPAGRAVAAVCWWSDVGKGTSMSGTRFLCPGQVGWLRWGGSTANSCADGPGSWTVSSFRSREGTCKSAGDVSSPRVCVARGDDSCCCNTAAELRWRGLSALLLAEQFVLGEISA